jgi:probable F420-dependent oxidoreductase
VIVSDWNGTEFERPYQRTRDVLRFVRRALAGERVDGDFETFAVRRFRLEEPPAEPVPLALAALRPQMLRLAGREADAAILNWLAPADVPRCVEAISNPDTEVIARIFVCPTDDINYAREFGRRTLAAYLTVPAYTAFHDWLGRGDRLRPMLTAWHAGDRRAALAALTDDLVDELVVHGPPEHCRDRIAAYAEAGIETPVLAMMPTPEPASPDRLTDVLRRIAQDS